MRSRRLGAAFNQMLARITSMKAEEIDTHRDLGAREGEAGAQGGAGGAHRRAVAALRRRALAQLHAGAARAARAHHRSWWRSGCTSRTSPSCCSTRRGCWRSRRACPAEPGLEGLTFAVGEGACGRAARALKRGLRAGPRATRPALRAARAVPRHRGGLAARACPWCTRTRCWACSTSSGRRWPAFAPERDRAAHGGGRPGRHGGEERAAARGDGEAHHHGPAHRGAQPPPPLLAAGAGDGPRPALRHAAVRPHGGHRPLQAAQRHRRPPRRRRVAAPGVRRCCAASVRKVDTLARYGGEEFMLVLPQVTKADALRGGREAAARRGGGPSSSTPPRPSPGARHHLHRRGQLPRRRGRARTAGGLRRLRALRQQARRAEPRHRPTRPAWRCTPAASAGSPAPTIPSSPATPNVAKA